METARSFTDVLDQLQSMELKFASVLIEATLKLATLADANFFILFESKDGRFYGGKEYLCDGYRNGLLSSTGNDVQLEADLETSSLRSKHVDGVAYEVPTSPPRPPPPPHSSSKTTLNGDHHRRHYLDLPASVSSSSSFSPSKRRKRKSALSSEDESSGIKQRKIQADRETLIDSVKEEAVFLIEPFECDANDFVGGTLVDGELPDAADINATYEPLTESQSCVSDWFFNDLRQNREMVEKMKSVRKLRNSQIQTMSNRDSDERRELLAMFYDYGKHFAAKFLDQELTRESRDYAFQIFWSHFVNLHPFEELRVPNKFLSSSCKDSFLHPYRRRKRLSMPKPASLVHNLE